MGLIRFALHIQTAGLVSDKSKKQRVANATLHAIREQTILQTPNMTPAQQYRAILAQRDLPWIDRARIKNLLNEEIKAGRGGR